MLLAVVPNFHATANAGLTAAAIVSHRPTASGPAADTPGMFAFLVVVVTVVCFIHQNDRPVRLALAVCLTVMAVYSFSQSAWLQGIVIGLWAGSNYGNWFTCHRPNILNLSRLRRTRTFKRTQYCDVESRITRMFGPK